MMSTVRLLNMSDTLWVISGTITMLVALVLGNDEPCQTIFDSTSGSLQSPNYPGRYDNFLDCEYFIRPVLDIGVLLRVEAVDFDLEGGYDTLEVRETGPHGRHVGYFTGTVIPILYGASYWMRFTSDFSNARKGFKIKWSEVLEGVRLVNGSNGVEGRVELYHAGKWGTICDDAWEPAEAFVTCKMLGFTDLTARHLTQGHFGRGADPIWLDNTKCSTSMTNLKECRVDPWGEHNCNHGEDSGVSCTQAVNTLNRISADTNSFPKGCSSSFSNTTGSLASPMFPQLYPNYAHCQYVIVPPQSPDLIQLVFSVFDLQDGADFLEIREEGPRGPFLGSFSGNRIPPTFYAKSIWMSFRSDASIGRQGFVAVWETTTVGVRLRNGTRNNEGRLEVYRIANIIGAWGTVCDDSFDQAEAQVVCRMLGYMDDINKNATALKGGYFGAGTGSILFDDMMCTGAEDDINDCPYADTHNCNHFEDSAIRCNSLTPKYNALSSNGSMIREDVSSAVTVTCDSMTLYVVVDLEGLDDRYSGLNEGYMYLTLGTSDCVGQRLNTTIVFNTDITDCGMIARENNDYIIYSNRIVSQQNDSFPINEVSDSPILVHIECSMSKTVSISALINPYKKTTTAKTVHGFGKFSAQLSFYKDPAFSRQIVDMPIYVELEQQMYLEARILTRDVSLKVLLYQCVATPSYNSTEDMGRPLIMGRCPVDSSTQILPSPSNSAVRFLFTIFKFSDQEMFITCRLRVCNATDTSDKCHQWCPQANSRRRRSLDDEHFVEVVQGPLIFKSHVGKEPRGRTVLYIGVLVAGAAITVLLVVAVILVLVSRRKKVTWLVNHLYEEQPQDMVMMLPLKDGTSDCE